MRFCEIVQELRIYLPRKRSQGDFVISLVDLVLRDPMDNEEAKEQAEEKFNPLKNLESDTLRRYFKGEKLISKSNASIICKRFDGANLTSMIDDLPESEREPLLEFLTVNGFKVEMKDLGYAYSHVLGQIFRGLVDGKDGVDIELDLYGKPAIATLASERVYYDREKRTIVVDGDAIKLPEVFSMDAFLEEEADQPHKFIEEILRAYADSDSSLGRNVEDVSSLPIKFQIDYEGHVEAFVSAEGIRRSVRDVYSDGENQFDILKDDAYNNVRLTYYDDSHENGYRRLRSVTNRAADAKLDKSTLTSFTNLIGSQEKWGIVHVLVEDGRIPSWVDPYEGSI
ncbi:ABC-three component system protein [Adlercreutzia sp. R25]|uniref:ABC-three component system protein n=1 Tax=Adlercreutzia shanghongiae TaxID=3111773 RepID=UPI002DBA3AD3|nr:ABC-three component system protein [Adlercreutzia sp. R25]MEC4273187.1 ABC-three component system protein [Adlercreutzia sp. R25]